MASAAEKVFALIEETVKNQGVTLWDVRFVKEGANRYLRVFIDKPDGITIDDCTAVSHAIDPIIDEADPIEESYYLEVCSTGIERELSKPQHFDSVIGKTIKIKLYKAVDGKKEYTGRLLSFTDKLVLEVDGTQVIFDAADISKANLCDFEINN